MATCILCGRDDGGDQHPEHVLQSFLGANLTLPGGVVCDRCNHATSALDGDLARYIQFRHRRDDDPALRRSTAAVKLAGTSWATRIRDPTWERIIPTQCVLLPDGSVSAWAPSERAMGMLRAELANPIKIDARSHAEFRKIFDGQPIVVRSKSGVFQLLASEADREAAHQRIASGTIPAARWTTRGNLQDILDSEGGPARAILDVNLNHTNRALAKVGFSFLAHCIGPDLVGGGLFNGVRRAVLNNVGESKHIINMDAVRQAAGSQGDEITDREVIAREIFGKEGAEMERLAEVVLQREQSVLLLGAGPRGLFAFLSVDEIPIGYVHLLPRLPVFEIRGILGGLVAHKDRNEPEQVLTPSNDQREQIRRAFQFWSTHLSAHAVIEPHPSFIRGRPQPFIFGFRYTARPR